MRQKNIYYQPKIDNEGNIAGHENWPAKLYSFQVWRKKENLLRDYPNCTPIKYSGNDIEDPTFEDAN